MLCMQSVLTMYWFICNVSLLFTAFYAMCRAAAAEASWIRNNEVVVEEVPASLTSAVDAPSVRAFQHTLRILISLHF